MTIASILIVCGLMLICVVMPFFVTRIVFGPIVTIGPYDVTLRLASLRHEIMLLRSTSESLKILSRCDETVACRFGRIIEQLDCLLIDANCSLEDQAWDHAHAVAMRGLSLAYRFKVLLQISGLTQITMWLLNSHLAEPLIVRDTKPSPLQMRNRDRLLWLMTFEKWR